MDAMHEDVYMHSHTYTHTCVHSHTFVGMENMSVIARKHNHMPDLATCIRIFVCMYGHMYVCGMHQVGLQHVYICVIYIYIYIYIYISHVPEFL
jgi:hypothetical protein